MFWHLRHLTDAELLLIEESALPATRLARGQRHLAQCRRCAARGRQLQRAVAALDRECAAAELPLPMPDASRAKLKARLEEARRLHRRAGGSLESWRLIATGLVAVTVVALLWTFGVERREDPTTVAQGAVAADTGLALPRPELTPGAVRDISVEEICEPTREVGRPMVDLMTAQQVFEHYGADFRRAEEYELDFLITPELGGTADVRNLWPQPYASTTWNAHVKDELEHLFRQRVCEGTMDIRTAQREIATDWISAYQRYFGTERPRDLRRDG